MPHRRLRASLFQGTNELRVKVLPKHGLVGPPLTLRIEHGDMIFVLKVKVEIALRLLHESSELRDENPLPNAESITLEFHGVPLRDMMAVDRYGIETGSEIVASYAAQPPERETVTRDPNFAHLEELIMAEPGVPSTGTIKRIISRKGKLCQVCWRSRWFRATVLNIYSTSLLMSWHDWPDAEWPNFFVRISLACTPDTAPDSKDETWRLRWHLTASTKELPVVQPRFAELPPLNWVKAFLRTYASADEQQMLREIQAQLPRDLIQLRKSSTERHRCLVLGARYGVTAAEQIHPYHHHILTRDLLAVAHTATLARQRSSRPCKQGVHCLKSLLSAAAKCTSQAPRRRCPNTGQRYA